MTDEKAPMYMESIGPRIGEIAAHIATLGHAAGSADYAMVINPRDCTYSGASYDRLERTADDLITSAIELRHTLGRLNTKHNPISTGNGSNGSDDEPEGAA